jgi:alkanesulfonate monooxygenase SsuD/methylene tetrahydromethanopterin reductase-like flavin-dependent oxidoreductase (luciferase family)
MKYGITLDRDGIALRPEPLKYLTRFAREAERMGCSYAVIGDRLESGVDPFLLLTAIAEASGSMQLVTSVVILPPRGVLVTAKQFAALDVLTGGRIIAGVGTGSLYRDYQIVGMPPEEMGPRFEEAVQAMRAYLTPDAAPFTGRFYDTTGVGLEPKSAQQPCLPIWIGSWGRLRRRCAGWRASRTAG